MPAMLNNDKSKNEYKKQFFEEQKSKNQVVIGNEAKLSPLR
jgi:hypothetical protein